MIRITKELARTIELGEVSNGKECARWLAQGHPEQGAVQEIGGGLARPKASADAAASLSNSRTYSAGE